ncbi:MAG: hypothetical protein ACJA1I_000210 [Zhongshania marina]|jgi:hypothetical protein
MTRKKTNDQAIELQEALTQAAVVERQLENQALLKSNEADEISGYPEERDLINQLVGQVQMASAFSKFTTVVSLTKLKYIKENKLYRTLSSKLQVSDGEKLTTVRTWDGFCRLMGMSANKVDEDIRNLEAFGEDALNSLNSIGAGYRELRKLRKLDDADRDLIINGEAVKAGDKDALVELIDEMAAKHVKEKDELTKQVADLQGTLNAREQVLENANKNKTQLEEEIEKLKGRKPDERLADLTKLLDAKKYEAVGCLRSLESILQQIAELPSGSKTLDLASGQVVALVRSTLDQIQHDYCLDTLDESGGRSWMDQAE